MRDLLRAGDDADLVECPDLRRQTAVDAEDGAVNDRGEAEEVEDEATGLPDVGVAVLLLAFVWLVRPFAVMRCTDRRSRRPA